MTTVLDAILNKMRRANAALAFEYFGVMEHTGPLTAPDPSPFTETDAIAWFDSRAQHVRARDPGRGAERACTIRPGGSPSAWGPYLDMRAGFDDWNGSHQQGLLSAMACGDRRGEAIMHRNLGQLALYQDDWDTGPAAPGRGRSSCRPRSATGSGRASPRSASAPGCASVAGATKG